jgi:hypothetical protein
LGWLYSFVEDKVEENEIVESCEDSKSEDDSLIHVCKGSILESVSYAYHLTQVCKYTSCARNKILILKQISLSIVPV